MSEQIVKLKPEVKTKWVAALRSGKYTQTKHVLRRSGENGYEYCALGVLCQVYVEEERGGRWNRDVVGTMDPSYSIHHWAVGNYKVLDLRLLIPADDGTVKMLAISWLNDSGDMKFAELANLIEEQL